MLDRLHKYILHLKLPKCEFLKPEVVYLSQKLSAKRLQPVEEIISAVKSIVYGVKKFHQFLCRGKFIIISN